MLEGEGEDKEHESLSVQFKGLNNTGAVPKQDVKALGHPSERCLLSSPSCSLPQLSRITGQIQHLQRMMVSSEFPAWCWPRE